MINYNEYLTKTLAMVAEGVREIDVPGCDEDYDEKMRAQGEEVEMEDAKDLMDK